MKLGKLLWSIPNTELEAFYKKDSSINIAGIRIYVDDKQTIIVDFKEKHCSIDENTIAQIVRDGEYSGELPDVPAATGTYTFTLIGPRKRDLKMSHQSQAASEESYYTNFADIAELVQELRIKRGSGELRVDLPCTYTTSFHPRVLLSNRGEIFILKGPSEIVLEGTQMLPVFKRGYTREGYIGDNQYTVTRSTDGLSLVFTMYLPWDGENQHKVIIEFSTLFDYLAKCTHFKEYTTSEIYAWKCEALTRESAKAPKPDMPGGRYSQFISDLKEVMDYTSNASIKSCDSKEVLLGTLEPIAKKALGGGNNE